MGMGKWGWRKRGWGNGDGEIGMGNWGWRIGDGEMGTGKEIEKCSENRLGRLNMGKWVREMKIGNGDEKYMVWGIGNGKMG